MKNRIAALSLSLALSVGLCAPAHAAEPSFTDVPADHWAASSIERMADAGVMSGVGNGQFAPDKTLSNAEFVTMVARQFYADLIGAEGGVWYAPYVEAAQAAGVLDGTEAGADGSKMEAPIDRYDMAQVMYNVICDKGMEAAPLADTSRVADWSAVPVAYQEAVSVCYNAGLLSGVDGKGTFNGDGEMTRAQAAVVMDRLIDGKTPVPPSGEIPAGATQITSVEQLRTATGAESCESGIHLNPNLVMYGSGKFAIDSKGCSSITFTIKAADVDTRVAYLVKEEHAGYLDPNVLRDEVVVKAGETRTITFDCSNTQWVVLNPVKDGAMGNFAECWITDIYLY